MDRERSKVFIIGVKDFTIYYLVDSDEVVSRLELETANEPQGTQSSSWDPGDSER
jgi:hypothetical protein